LDSETDFKQLFRDVGERRLMYLPDDRYATLVAFATGCDAATGWRLLSGFNAWVAERTIGNRSSLHWSVLAAVRSMPALLERPEAIGDMAMDVQARSCVELLRLLDRFLTRQEGGSGEVDA
jgi:hypothetical protein